MSTRRTRFVAALHGIRGDLGRATEELAEPEGDLMHVMYELDEVRKQIGDIHEQLVALSAEALAKALDAEKS